mmetsp:Transcript_12702/g.42994  ORF Transcript_12702/g.42994 Transcript_12702/m.42994 type:complete len:124 (-) Transcript_12702:684-1055(-)
MPPKGQAPPPPGPGQKAGQAVDTAVTSLGRGVNKTVDATVGAFGQAIGGATWAATFVGTAASGAAMSAATGVGSKLKDAGQAVGEDITFVRRYTGQAIEAAGDAVKYAGEKVAGKSAPPEEKK